MDGAAASTAVRRFALEIPPIVISSRPCSRLVCAEQISDTEYTTKMGGRDSVGSSVKRFANVRSLYLLLD